MKVKRLLFGIVVWLAVIITAVNTVGFVYDSFFFNMEQLPTGNYVSKSTSANRRYTLSLYKVKNSLGEAVRGELTDNKTGEIKNVYWETGEPGHSAKWLNNELININGHVVDITKDIYDSRRPIIDSDDIFSGKKR